MIFLYNIGITLYQCAIYVAAIFNKKAQLWVAGRKDIFLHIKKKYTRSANQQTLWMHVSSLGEFEQGRPVIEALKKKAPQLKIVLTFFSPSGYEIRKNYTLADYIYYMPMDSRRNAQQFIELIQPDFAIFVKYDFWYHYLNQLNKKHIPTLLISSIFNKKQFSNFNFYKYYLKECLSKFTHIFVQNTPSVEALTEQGFSNVTQAGDTRIDRVLAIAQESRQFPEIAAFVGNAPTLICGSTWQPDEDLIVPLINHPDFRDWKFIFAPHDVSENNVQRLDNQLVNAVRFTQWHSQNQAEKQRVLIIDNIGMLSALYRYGRVAYIGGGFGKSIHNTLEPIAFGLPVVFGPKYTKFEEAVKLVETGGGFSVKTYDDFLKTMLNLTQPDKFQAASQAANNYIIKNKGATSVIIQFLNQYFLK